MYFKNEDFREFSRFVESVRGSSRQLLERIELLENAFGISGKVRRCVSEGIRLAIKIRKIAISRRDGFANARVREKKRKISGRRKALRVTPRGKQWLTVYRAHQVGGKRDLLSDSIQYIPRLRSRYIKNIRFIS